METRWFGLRAQQGEGAHAGQFRLQTRSGPVWIAARENEILTPVRGGDSFGAPGAWFNFELESLDYFSIEFDVKNAVILSTSPMTVFEQNQLNGGPIEQEQDYKINEETEQQSNFETEFGLELGASTEISCGLPYLADGKVQLSAKVHANLKWTKTATTKQVWEATVKLKCPPRTKMKVTASVSESVMNVRIVTTWKSRNNGATMTTKGIYNGLSCSNLKTNYFEVDKNAI